MAEDAEELAFPLEIPWQLASVAPIETGGGLSAPDATSLALFTYVPHLPNLEADYPNDRLIYLKLSVSISPFSIKAHGRSDKFRLFSDTGSPVWRLMLDLRIAQNPAPTADAVKPCFLAAAPIRRAMFETGVVGQQVFEGESDELAVGKSGSQLREEFNSKTKTSGGKVGASVGGVLSAVGLSASYGRATTAIEGERSSVQQSDTTQRQAARHRPR